MDLDALRAKDRAVVRLARRVKLLTTLSWPTGLERQFLAELPNGRPRLPDPPRVQVDLSEVREGLEAVRRDLDPTHPLEGFLDRTAASVVQSARLLESAHTKAFNDLSRELYGAPTDAIHPSAPTNLEAAEHYVARSVCPRVAEPEATLDAEQAAVRMREALQPHFVDEPLPVELDDDLTSKAAAGSKRVALRRDARFSPIAVDQLVQHEALVHAATRRAGKAQPVLSALGLSTARTTVAQEGLATLAEMITDTMDLARLRRIALRILAIQAALDGADFVEVFELFREQGQSDLEAWHSARRVFRGGDVRGGVAFTKDVVYLRGLMRVHTFLLEAEHAGRDRLPHVLFAGRMTLGDALELEPFFDDGTLQWGTVLPDWVRNTACLAAYLTWAAFNDRIRLDAITLDDFREA